MNKKKNLEPNASNLEPNASNYEKRSFKKFLICAFIGFTLGAILGFTFSMGSDYVMELISRYAAAIKNVTLKFELYVCPFILLFMLVAAYIHNNKILKISKQQIENWDGEDDDYINAVDKKLNRVTFFSNIGAISSIILFALICYNIFAKLNGILPLIFIASSIIIYISSLIIFTSQQNRMINLIKMYAPEKKGSIYDKRFQKVWLDSCDEREKAIIYEVSYKTFMFTTKILATLLIITCVLGMFFPIGILCSLLVGGIWLVITIYYMVLTAKMENK